MNPNHIIEVESEIYQPERVVGYRCSRCRMVYMIDHFSDQNQALYYANECCRCEVCKEPANFRHYGYKCAACSAIANLQALFENIAVCTALKIDNYPVWECVLSKLHDAWEIMGLRELIPWYSGFKDNPAWDSSDS